jgi:hypothetical protein
MGRKVASQRFRCRQLEGGRPLAVTPDGKVFCAAYDRGEGRLIVLSVPRGLGIDRAAVPALPLLFAHLTRGLMPVEVSGNVEWLVNRTKTGWIVTLLNPAGQAKPQQGITPTDFRENRAVTIRSAGPIAGASDWLFPDEPLVPRGKTLELVVPAGRVRIVGSADAGGDLRRGPGRRLGASGRSCSSMCASPGSGRSPVSRETSTSR